MAIKNKTNKDEEVIIETVTNNGLDDLGLETEYSEGTSFTLDVDGLDKISINELDIGDTVDGMPEFVLFDNSNRTNANGTPRKWDSICCRFVDLSEFVECYLPCPRPDKNGIIKNVWGNGFYHGTFNLIYSYLRTLDKTNVLDNEGNIINTIKQVNIVKLLEKLNEYSKMEIKVMSGADNDMEYLTFMITEME